ncbi:TRAP-type C4-dicarboxylate transporter, periplasmic solute-binding protein [Desulforapulum autotrophicum HRM2]|uniref:TRAP-type C4-dicarboxylate transporter, periplasmic solute-binding protein n=1 Tax=Desulforapulum autotrophicum (strain ATCC 43914 / DSM 3382 / VKM B-1955 / HRM2) TaxID=177437 RepID=C0QFU8_DESAH|nr:response regulator transcription factor [Desulforapulum autotrophicum]ACN15516.1 TRAP-type C4-dicarboxylate transporter, periplasmic solute-binding protein [Desulforapulum autotrophicum HRM2]
MNKIKVLVAEDHTIVRKGLCSLLYSEPDIEVVGEAENGREAIKMVEELAPDVVLMDISMPELNGMDATRQLKKKYPDVKILILSMHSTEEYIFETLRAGASGYLIKRSAPTDLIKAIHAAHAGDCFLSPSISKKVIKNYVQQKQGLSLEPRGLDLLSAREREVLQLIAEGHANREIAGHLYISPKTVEAHRNHIQKKLGLNGTAELTKYAIRKGLVELG